MSRWDWLWRGDPTVEAMIAMKEKNEMGERDELIKRLENAPIFHDHTKTLDLMRDAVLYLLEARKAAQDDAYDDLKRHWEEMRPSTAPATPMYDLWLKKQAWKGGRESMKEEILEAFEVDPYAPDYTKGIVKKIKP